jgi:hypothetical protein
MLSIAGKRIISAIFVFAVVFCMSGITQAQIVLDFEDESLNDWEIIDEDPKNLGDLGPSTWQIRDTQLGLDGKVLYQGSNIWGTVPDSCLMGTFIIYEGQKFSNFTMEIDVAAADNDGMGVVWAFNGTDSHYRAIMINDKWPDPEPVDGIGGPFMKIAKRISDDEPWYELLSVIKDNYVPYAEGVVLHWTLEVEDGVFTFTRDDGLSITAEDHDYTDGYVGLQLYAQQSEFDNITIIPHDDSAPVQPNSKLATSWGTIKSR